MATPTVNDIRELVALAQGALAESPFKVGGGWKCRETKRAPGG